MTQTQLDQAKLLVKQAATLISGANRDQLSRQLATAEEPTQVPAFWHQADKNQVLRQISVFKKKLTELDQLVVYTNNLQALIDLAAEDSTADLEAELTQTIKLIEQQTAQVELTQYLSGKYDSYPALLSIHSGQGGTEAMDWAEMLSRMYLRYFEKHDWRYRLVSESRGEEAGIKAASYEVEAPYAYGYLKGERGTHRLVRQSPFNADSLRQTSFALVEVMPLIEADDKELEIKDEDLDWHFSRSGGAGGQNVNKVNTAVELTHRPTGLVVKCREERTQFQNKERALKLLKAKLAILEEEKLEAELKLVKGEYHHASWGSQIRNYVLHPYKLVKDTRTKVESSEPDKVLDGELDEFIRAEIKLHR